LDLKKAINGWQGIKQQTRDAIFESTPEEGKRLDAVISGMKSLTNQVKVIKFGTIAAGAGLAALGFSGGRSVTSAAELLVGLAGVLGGKYGSRGLAEDLITNPRILSGLGKLSGYSANWLGAASATAGVRSKIASGIKGGIVSHIYNPQTKQVEPVTTQPGEPIPTEKPTQTMEQPAGQTFGELPAEKLVPAMASFEGGKSNDLNVRLNNPINLLFKNQPGATPYRVGDKVFANFATPETGKQAAIKQLRLDQSRPEYSGMSLEDYINKKHSPDSDNYTGQAKVYAKHVLTQLASAQQYRSE
jgi:hypothetical protein